MSDWNAAQYLKFEVERTQPSIDLAAKIPLQSAQKVLDVGCGPGNSTAVVAKRFPVAHVLGVDNSPDMVRTAQQTHPELDFSLCDVSGDLSVLGGGYDLVFSNAVLQWIPDHPALLRRLLGLLRPGGVLAVQIPMNRQEPIHQIIARQVESPQWKPYFEAPRIFYTLEQGEYFDLLDEFSANFSLWQTTYFHRLGSHRDILEWYRGTGLRPYLNALTPELAQAFEAELLPQLQAAYPLQKNGQVIFRFPRFFFTAFAQ